MTGQRLFEFSRIDDLIQSITKSKDSINDGYERILLHQEELKEHLSGKNILNEYEAVNENLRKNKDAYVAKLDSYIDYLKKLRTDLEVADTEAGRSVATSTDELTKSVQKSTSGGGTISPNTNTPISKDPLAIYPSNSDKLNNTPVSNGATGSTPSSTYSPSGSTNNNSGSISSGSTSGNTSCNTPSGCGDIKKTPGKTITGDNEMTSYGESLEIDGVGIKGLGAVTGGVAQAKINLVNNVEGGAAGSSGGGGGYSTPQQTYDSYVPAQLQSQPTTQQKPTTQTAPKVETTPKVDSSDVVDKDINVKDFTDLPNDYVGTMKSPVVSTAAAPSANSDISTAALFGLGGAAALGIGAVGLSSMNNNNGKKRVIEQNRTKLNDDIDKIINDINWEAV